MKNQLVKLVLLAMIMVISQSAFSQGGKKKKGDKVQTTESGVVMQTKEDSVSYSYGHLIAESMKLQGITEMDYDLFMLGIKDMFEGNTPLIESAAANMLVVNYLQDKQAKAGEDNMAKGTSFLEENKSKAGVVVLPSGLQYKILEEGTGNMPSADDEVKVHYEGKLIDGTIFDSSIQRGEPIVFGVNQVIKGWQEALQLMKEGSRWMLYIPADLAYGASGAGDVIGPNEVLIFEVELIAIEE